MTRLNYKRLIGVSLVGGLVACQSNDSKLETAENNTSQVATPVEITLTDAQSSDCDAAAAPRHDKQQLRRDDRWLIDKDGRVVLTHGVNTVWKRAPYFPPETAEGFLEADARWLYEHGLNSARLGTLFVGLMQQQAGQIETEYLEAWSRVIDLMAEYKIWMQFDFHQDLYNEEFQGEGFPDWAVYDFNSPTNWSQLGFPNNYFTEPTQTQYDKLYANAAPRGADQIWDHFRDAWIAVATRFRDQPYSMGYDLMNEPWPGTAWLECLTPDATTLASLQNLASSDPAALFQAIAELDGRELLSNTTGETPVGCPDKDALLQQFFTHSLNGIRSVDPDNIVWFEPYLIFDFGTSNYFEAIPGEDQLGFSFHDYCLAGVFAHAAGATDIPSCEQNHGVVHANAEVARARMNAVSMLTEFGASDDLSDLAQAVTEADRGLVGWQYWHYKEWQDPTTESQESGGQGLFTDDTDLSTLKLDKAKILIRSYPQYTAGIPQQLSFDPDSAVMNYRYVPRRSGARTEVYVPTQIHYPNGYSFDAQGVEDVEVVENGRRLLITEQAGACEVSLRIDPLGP